jgi:hypothetical protein
MRNLFLVACGCIGLSASAETLRFEGVIGNSGELDKPVTFGPMQRGTRGLGVAHDAKRGVLYERAGSGRLNAYALDGRLLAQYTIPTDENHQDMMTLCADHLVMLLGGRLCTLRLNAPDGAAAEKVTAAITEPEMLSSSAREGRVAVRSKSGKLVLLNPSDNTVTPFGDAPGAYCTGMDWDEKGDFFLIFGKDANKLENGQLVSNSLWPKRFIGTRESGIDCATRLGAYWYGSAWHGTIKRFTADFEPAPGVVLGGASGHFIGHVPCNYDVELARGIRLISPGLFAIGGMYGVVQLAEWRPDLKNLVLIRRIGALAQPGGIAVDAQGRILAGNNIWNWKDGALAPADVSNVFKMIAPCATLDADTLVGLAEVYGKVSIAMGRFEEEALYCNRLDKLDLPKDVVGVALYREQPKAKGGWRFLVLGSAGQAKVHEIVEDLRNPWRKDLGDVKLQTATPVKAFTAVTMLDADTLIAAADGQVITFGRDGANWKETERWSDGFGAKVRLAVSEGRLAVADTEKNRVVLYALTDHRKLAEAQATAPTEVALNNNFLVVYDSVGQRLMKFRVHAGN